MVTRAEKVAAIDAFMAAQKRVLRTDRQGIWAPGHNPHEKILKWPIEVGLTDFLYQRFREFS
jgi:hypothetical protein